MATVKHIPDGFHTVKPHLIVKGAGKALDFYAQAFGAKEQVRMPGPGGSIMHAQMQIGDSIIMLADENPEMGNRGPQTLGGSSVVLWSSWVVAALRSAPAPKAGARGTMPLTEMFWGDRYGQVTDPFGHLWSIATHQKDVTPDEMRKA